MIDDDDWNGHWNVVKVCCVCVCVCVYVCACVCVYMLIIYYSLAIYDKTFEVKIVFTDFANCKCCTIVMIKITPHLCNSTWNMT